MKPPTRLKLQYTAVLSVMTLIVLWTLVPRFRTTSPVKVDTVLENGEHLIAILMVGSNGEDPPLDQSMRMAVDRLRERARREGVFFSTIGISPDFDVSRGLGRLEQVDPVDEKIVGRGWLNSGLRIYVSEQGASQSVPQIVVLRNTVRASPPPLSVLHSRELLRLVGRDQILQWVRAQRTPSDLR